MRCSRLLFSQSRAVCLDSSATPRSRARGMGTDSWSGNAGKRTHGLHLRAANATKHQSIRSTVHTTRPNDSLWYRHYTHKTAGALVTVVCDLQRS
jgi:hypothetical protein